MFTILTRAAANINPTFWDQLMNFFEKNWFLVILFTIFITVGAQIKVKNTVSKYSKVETQTGLTGREVAEKILESEGIADVNVKPIQGALTDNYNPTKKTVFLSEEVYNKSTIVAASIAAHEVGHAIQHHTKYFALNLRQTAFYFARGTSMFTGFMLIIAILSGLTSLIILGIVGLIFGLIFQIVTLPVEYNASSRAKAKLEKLQLVTGTELKQANEILGAAALTYLAAMVSTLLYILRLLAIANRR